METKHPPQATSGGADRAHAQALIRIDGLRALQVSVDRTRVWALVHHPASGEDPDDSEPGAWLIVELTHEHSIVHRGTDGCVDLIDVPAARALDWTSLGSPDDDPYPSLADARRAVEDTQNVHEALTAKEAAAKAGMELSSFHAEMTRERQRGRDHRTPRDQWRDERSPTYDGGALDDWLQRRHERSLGKQT